MWHGKKGGTFLVAFVLGTEDYLVTYILPYDDGMYCTVYTLGHPLNRGFLSEVQIGLQISCSISPTADGTCQKCFTKHHD